ncbi:hypothetical protein Misp02_55390 [Microtetraspora sp. NBRC 16547]|nr:hypothetical protein Misp02_55390 [Microtetraspora sp. NBRC 16547]
MFTDDLLSRCEYIMIKVAASCGGARRDGRLSRLPLSIIREYIENQKRPDQRPGGEREAIPPGRERPGFLAIPLNQAECEEAGPKHQTVVD